MYRPCRAQYNYDVLLLCSSCHRLPSIYLVFGCILQISLFFFSFSSRKLVMGSSSSKEKADFWKPDTASALCEICEAKFTLLRRRHHCRSCGGLFCDDCSKGRSLLPGKEGQKMMRVCNMCAMRAGGTSEGSATPRALTPRNSMRRDTSASLAVSSADNSRLSFSAPHATTSNTRHSSPVKKASMRKQVVTSLSRQTAVFNPARRRAMMNYLLCLKVTHGAMLPKPATDLLVQFLGQVYFIESVANPVPSQLHIARNKCHCVFAAGSASKSTESVDSANNGDGAQQLVRHTSAFLTPALPSGLALGLYFTIFVQQSKHFEMEVGLAHQSFLPGGTNSKKIATNSGSLRVSHICSTKIAPIGLHIPSRRPLVSNTASGRPSDGMDIEGGPEEESGAVAVSEPSMIHLSIHWDGQSRTVTFVTSELIGVTEDGKPKKKGAAVDMSTVSMDLPSGVAGKWHVAFSAESAGEVKLVTL